MEDYLNFNDEQLYKDLAERLKIAEEEKGVLQRCCEAWQYAFSKKEKELQDVQTMFSQSVQLMNDMARTQEKMAEKIVELKQRLSE